MRIVRLVSLLRLPRQLRLLRLLRRSCRMAGLSRSLIELLGRALHHAAHLGVRRDGRFVRVVVKHKRERAARAAPQRA